MKQLVERLKEQYDYVILDCVPAHMMADAAVVSHLSDLTAYVIRDNGIDRRFLPELERIHKEGKFNNLCVVINDINNKNNKGYSYDYKYTYNYKCGDEKKYSRAFKRSMRKLLRRSKQQ